MSDLYQAVTDRIVAALEQDAPPWVRPWSQVTDAIPVNAPTRRPYRGVNFTLLSLESAAGDYPVSRRLTYRQALELGAQVRRGERGSPVVFWQLRRVAATAEVFPQDDDPPAELPDKVYPLLWSQVDLARALAWVHSDQAKARRAIAVPLNGEAMATMR